MLTRHNISVGDIGRRLVSWWQRLVSAMHLEDLTEQDRSRMPDRSLGGTRQGERRALGDGGETRRQGASDPARQLARRGPVGVRRAEPHVTSTDRFKFLLFIVAIVVLIGVTILILPYFTSLLTEENRASLQAYISSAGPWGVVILFGLEVLQVVVAVIPGGVVELIAGALYGTVWGSVIVIAGSFVSAVIVYYLVHKLGAPFVQRFVSDSDMRFMNFLRDPRKLNTMVFVLYLIPGLPKDVFTYLVPLTEMPAKDFFILSTLGRSAAIIASAYMGSAMINGNLVGAVLVFIVIMVLAVTGLIVRDNISEIFDKYFKNYWHA